MQAPKGTGTEQITAALPADAACAGGASKNKCLASFTTAGGFGNCVVVQQGGTAGNASTAAAPTTGATATDGQGNNQGKGNAANNGKTVPREVGLETPGTLSAYFTHTSCVDFVVRAIGVIPSSVLLPICSTWLPFAIHILSNSLHGRKIVFKELNSDSLWMNLF